jgi:arylsulfatase A-like enzyme
MKMLRLLIVCVLPCLFLITCAQQPVQQKTEKPNVLLIMIDDLNDYEGTYGGHPQARTPHIDRLAESATVFTSGHTNTPVCTPSRNSMFSGVYSHNSRDFGWTPQVRHAVLKHNKTFIELFRENGYQTYGTGKLMHKNVPDYWDEWGVRERINYSPHAFDGENPVGHPSVPEPFRSINFVDGSFAPLSDIPEFNGKQTGWTYGDKPFRYVNDDDRDPMPDEMHAQWITGTIAELEKRDEQQPFFMGVGFVNPHTPLYAPQRFFDMFPLDEIELPVIKENDAEDCFYTSVYPPSEMGLHYYQALKESYASDNEGLRLFLQAYLACIAFVDEQIGIVMDALDNSEFSDNTIVILVSDHGWQIGEKDYLYKNSPWEESTRIPYIIRVPGESKPGSEVDHPVSLIDIFPTLIDMCNLQGTTTKNNSAPTIDGYSLRPFLRDTEYDEWDGPDGALTVMGAGINTPIEGIGVNKNKGALWHIEILQDLDDSYVMKQNYSYRTKDWRYIRYRNGKEELYDHRTDPYEWNNLAGDTQHAKPLQDLRDQMMAIINKKRTTP